MVDFFLGSNKFLGQKFLGQKKFWVKITFRLKKNFGHTIFLGQKFLWVKKKFASKKYFVPKNILGQKNFGKKMWVKNFFGLKNVW